MDHEVCCIKEAPDQTTHPGQEQLRKNAKRKQMNDRVPSVSRFLGQDYLSTTMDMSITPSSSESKVELQRQEVIA